MNSLIKNPMTYVAAGLAYYLFVKLKPSAQFNIQVTPATPSPVVTQPPVPTPAPTPAPTPQTFEVSPLQGLPDSNTLMAYGLVGLASYMLVPKPILVVGSLAAYHAVTNK